MSNPEAVGALLRLGEFVRDYGIDTPGRHRAARDLLLCKNPRLLAGEKLRRDGEGTVACARRVVLALDGGVLAIQGPPGARNVMRKLLERRSALRGSTPLVAVVEATEPRQADNLGLAVGTTSRWAARGRRLAEAEVREVVVVVGDVVSEQALQVVLVEHPGARA